MDHSWEGLALHLQQQTCNLCAYQYRGASATGGWEGGRVGAPWEEVHCVRGRTVNLEDEHWARQTEESILTPSEVGSACGVGGCRVRVEICVWSCRH